MAPGAALGPLLGRFWPVLAALRSLLMRPKSIWEALGAILDDLQASMSGQRAENQSLESRGPAVLLS